MHPDDLSLVALHAAALVNNIWQPSCELRFHRPSMLAGIMTQSMKYPARELLFSSVDIARERSVVEWHMVSTFAMLTK